MKKIFSVLICFLLAVGLTACEKMDPKYGQSETKTDKAEKSESTVSKEQIEISEIKSNDEVMPIYFDISLYDEENYSDIYLGKDFEYRITYAGSTLNVPCDYSDMTEKGWTLVPSDKYSEDSQILVGKSLKVQFVNEYGKQITAVFYNNNKSSVLLKECQIVKFIIAENNLVNNESVYAQFWVNGVSNECAITDIIQCLGAPSHFYSINDNKYYLDWFITESDRRNRITVYVDIAEDHIDSIEFSHY